MTKLYTAFASVLLLCCMIGSPLALQAQSCKGKTSALEALGSVSGAMIYNTYLVIGEAADAFSGNAYNAAEVKQILDEQIPMIGAVDSSYIKLLASGFLTDTSDIGYVKEIRISLDLIRAEAMALNVYVASGLTADANYYDACRKKAWDAIKKLLDITD